VSRTKAAQFFDERVEEWQRRHSTPEDYWYRRNTLGSSWLSRYLGRNSKCLEIGCAAGQFCELLYRQGHVVFGVDIAEAMIETSRRRLAALGVPASHFQCCEPDSLPFGDNSFDLATGLDVLPYVEDQPHFLKEVGRVLRPNGLAFFTNVNPRSLFTLVTVIKILPKAFGGKYFVPGRSWWRGLYKFIRTGYSSGGFVDLPKAVQARSADMLDRFFVEAGFSIVDGYDMYNLRRFDRRPFDRKPFSAWAARQWAWNHFGLYRKRP
jgi:ubiquinone/menaquinone biosynthesis C-methylase UbiE